MNHRKAVSAAIFSAVFLSCLSTLADWIWARYLTDGALLPALVHGVLFFVALATVLGCLANSRQAAVRLLATLPLAGLGIAAAFYPVAGAVGYLPALLLCWLAMWLALATLQGWAQREAIGIRPIGRRIAVGSLAALGSGLAFWSISGIWTEPDAFQSNWLRWLAWTWAYLPGFLVLSYSSTVARRNPSALDP